MKAFYHKNSKKSGIYKITNVNNGHCYYGSCKSFKQRFLQHKNALERGKHYNYFLQRDFNRHNKGSFIFEVVEAVNGSKYKRQNIEQQYLDKWYGQKNCYNLSEVAVISTEDIRHKKEQSKIKKSNQLKARWKHDKEFREKMSGKNHPSYGKPRPIEVKQAISKKALGNTRWRGKKHTEETKKKMSEIAKKRGIFQKTREAQKKALTGKKQSKELIQKRVNARKNYEHSSDTKEKIGSANSKLYDCVLIDNNGNQYNNIYNLSKFCRKHNLDNKKMYLVIQGKRKHHKGWSSQT